MKKIFIVLIGLIAMISYLTGCNKVASAPKVEVEEVIDVYRYGGLTSGELLSKLGDPPRTDKWIFRSTSGHQVPATSYFFEINHFPVEFIVVDNKVAGLNVLPPEDPEHDMEIETHKDVLALTGILPEDDMITVLENSVTARYTAVNANVREVWVTLNDKKVDSLRVSFENKYFD